MAPAGWNTGEQIRDHKLSASIINGHGTEDSVFDDANMEVLQRFCIDPSIETRNTILQEHGWIDAADQRPGENAGGKGSLVGLLVARHGTENPALDQRDLEMLEEWFKDGMPQGRHVVH